ncbi:DUF3601 domain-containing protein [Flavimaricola marinus]|uniref:Uncharacterized protein n=1 Tax=Flavimaricola marinus TaxID=1819565 RepID=A0A238LAL4_9RHOB|nr:DUF3601 domain-containing protein [Flavimaricola marinus]SMY06651.1 hypothetical protein LOM8899_00779 [Flavimaricola marinus]
MSHDFAGVHPQVDALVNLYGLPARPARQFVRGLSGRLDFAGLSFGTRYRVTKDLFANIGGRLSKGEKVHFLGCYVFPHKNGLRLYVERANGEQVKLEFDCSAAHEPGVVARVHNGLDYFAPIVFDMSKRTRKLLAARAVLLHLKKKEPDHGG